MDVKSNRCTVLPMLKKSLFAFGLLLAVLLVFTGLNYAHWRHLLAVEKYKEGRELQVQGRDAQAESAYRMSLSLKELAETHLQLARMRLDKNQRDAALSESLRAIELFKQGKDTVVSEDQAVQGLVEAYLTVCALKLEPIVTRMLSGQPPTPAEISGLIQEARSFALQALAQDPLNQEAKDMLQRLDTQLELAKQLQLLTKTQRVYADQVQNALQQMQRLLSGLKSP
jgi:hypothetical protein